MFVIAAAGAPIGALIAVVAIATLLVRFVFGPLFATLQNAEHAEPQLDPRITALEDRRERLALAKQRKLDEILELRGDHEAGKIATPDFRDLDRRLRGEAADLLHELDGVEAELSEFGVPTVTADPLP
jgi:glycine/D-amino acid oxidase-like deaminating enzyme